MKGHPLVGHEGKGLAYLKLFQFFLVSCVLVCQRLGVARFEVRFLLGDALFGAINPFAEVLGLALEQTRDGDMKDNREYQP
jgi:hypothetical protein